MGRDDVDFLASLAANQLSGAYEALPSRPKGRGNQFHQLGILLLNSAKDEIERIRDEAASAGEEDFLVLQRQLIRLRDDTTRVIALIGPYLSAVDNRELSAGFTAVVDFFVESLLGGDADPAVYVHESFQTYSTLSPVTLLEGYMEIVQIDASSVVPKPLALNVPHLHSESALLSPILAHEIAHAAVERRRLVQCVVRAADSYALEGLLTECLSKVRGGRPSAWKELFYKWVKESVCDLIAAALMGPSFILSLAAFLPALRPPALGDHPPAADRLRILLGQIDTLNWRSVLPGVLPNTDEWLRNLAATVGDPSKSQTAEERFARESLQLVEAEMRDVANAVPTETFDPACMSELVPELRALLTAGVPPAQVREDEIPTIPQIVLAAWLQWFEDHGDAPASIPSAVSDRQFNAFIVKSFEMARLSTLWKTT